MAKNRSPPPRSRSRSASIVSQPDLIPDRTKPSGNPGLHSCTANRKVRFPPEVEDEQVMDPKEDTISCAPATSGPSPRTLPSIQTVQIQQTGKGSSSQRPGIIPKNLATPRRAPTKRLRLQGDIGMIEEVSSDQGETPDNRNPGSSQNRGLPKRDANIRSGIKDLLDANKKTPVVDTNTAIVLESLLLQMDQGSSGRSVLSFASVQVNDSNFRALTNPSPAAVLSSRTRVRATFVGRLNTRALLTDNTT